MLDLTSNEDRILALEAQVRELTTIISRSKKPAKTKPTPPEVFSVMEPIKWLSDEVIVDNAGGASTGWVTFDASEYLPMDCRVVLVDVYAKNPGSAGETRLQVRRQDGEIELEVAAGYAASDVVSGQALCPVLMSYEKRSFDYNMTSAGAGTTWTIRVVGYIKSSKVYGASVKDGRVGAGGTPGTTSGVTNGVVTPIS